MLVKLKENGKLTGWSCFSSYSNPISNVFFYLLFFSEQLSQLLISMGKLYTISYYGYLNFYYYRYHYPYHYYCSINIIFIFPKGNGYLSNRPHFPWVYRRDKPREINHTRCWENTRKACKSRAVGEWLTSFLSVLSTSQVDYHAGKPIESVLYCFYKITMSLPAQ